MKFRLGKRKKGGDKNMPRLQVLGFSYIYGDNILKMRRLSRAEVY
jgi:hypothetical protein